MNKRRSHILVIDDHEATRETLSEVLVDGGHRVTSAESRSVAIEKLSTYGFDLILSDMMLPDGTGMEILEAAKRYQSGVPFVFITGHGSIENAIEATRQGAYEYITKPLDLNKLRVVVKNALHLCTLERRVGERDCLDAIIGQSKSIVALKEMIIQVARTEATVLIHGETGTGKELVARAIQALSDRRDEPFVKVNIAALPRELLESELFGHEKGAFTGAFKTRQGRFELANKGTLFLDEISEMPVETQVKLLRVLQEHEFERVGGNDVLISDFRLIVATNRDLKVMVQEGTFREDLYFRINVVCARIPNLRSRKEDIPLLCEHFLTVYNTKYGIKRELSREAHVVLSGYQWSGNIRELENAIERAVVTSQEESIFPDDLPEEVRGVLPPLGGECAGTAFPEGLTIDEVERKYTLSELERLGGNKTKLAKSLNIGLKTLYRKLELWNP